MRRLSVLMLMAGCSKGELVVTPASLSFGEPDFQQEIPATGLNSIELTLVNAGKGSLDVEITNFDGDHLILGGFFPDEPMHFETLDEGSSVQFTVGVGAYEPGERDTLVEGSFDLDASGLKEPVSVPWSFTPVRDIGGDTGP